MEDQKYNINWFYKTSIEKINETTNELIAFGHSEEAFIINRHRDIYNSIFDVDSISKFKRITDLNLYKKTALEELAATIEHCQLEKNALIDDFEMVLDSAITLTVAIRMHNTEAHYYLSTDQFLGE